MAQQSEIQIVLKAKDELTKELKKATAELKRMESAVKSSSSGFNKGMKDMGVNAQDTHKHVKTLLGTVNGLGAARLFGLIGAFYLLRTAVQGVASSVQKFGEFERLKAGLAAVTTEVGSITPQLERLREVAKLPGLGFEEAIQGSVNLQAAGLSAQTAERALKGFGNALATVGKGREDLKGVITALTQITAKGKVSAEEILQLQERLPQIRVAMQDAFGTASTEELAKLGIGAEEFVNGIIAEFEKLPPVTGGILNAVENLQDEFNQLSANIGSVFAPALTPAIESLSLMIGLANEQGAAFEFAAKVVYSFTNLMIGLVKATGFVGVAFYSLYKATRVVFESIGNIIGALLLDIGKVGAAFIQLVSGDFEGAMDTITSGSSLGKAFDMITENVGDSFEDIKNLASAVGSEVALSFDRAFNFTDFNFEKDLQGMGKAADFAAGALEDNADALKKQEAALKSLLTFVQKFNDGMDKFAEAWDKAKEQASEAISRIRDNANDKFKSIKESIRGVNEEMANLRIEFAKGLTTDRNNLAGQFIEAEKRVEDLKHQLARATDVQQIFDIKNQLKDEEAALARTKDIQLQFANEIANAREHANLSEIEQAIADFNEKRSLATQELNLQLANFEVEKQALREKREEEKRLSEEAIQKVREELREKKLAIQEEQKAFIEGMVKDLTLETGKGEIIKQITDEVEKFRTRANSEASGQIKKNIREEIDLYKELARAIERANSLASSGKKNSRSVDDAVITPRGQVINTDPADYIFATKNPGSLAGGSSIIVNVNGGNYLSEDAAEKMGDLIIDRLQGQYRV